MTEYVRVCFSASFSPGDPMRILDVADDLGASLIARFKPDELPELVKTAEWREPAKARDRDFALLLVDTDGSHHRKYACHDPGSTVVSMLYLQNAVDEMNPAAVKVAAANLASLAKDWGLDVPDEISKLASIELTDLQSRDVIDARTVRFDPPKRFTKTAGVQPSGPFEKLASVKRDWYDMDPQARRAAAQELVKAASVAPIVVPPEVSRYAGEGLSTKFASHMATRARHVRSQELALEYANLAKIASAFDPDSIVDAIYVLDAHAGIRYSGGDQYNDRLVDPVLCVYDRVKEAAWSWNRGAEATNETELHEFAHRSGAREVFTCTFTDELWTKFIANPVGTFKAMPPEQQVFLSRMAREV